jgi:hypothetical protein
MIRTKAGFTTASKDPNKNRFTAIPANDEHAGVVISMIPQMMVVMPTTFPIGRSCKA